MGGRRGSLCPRHARDLIAGSFGKTFIWLKDPEFSNRILPPCVGLSEKESRICRDIYKSRFADIP